MPELGDGQSKEIYVCLEAGATHSGFLTAMELIEAVGPSVNVDGWKWQTHQVDDLIGEDYNVDFVTVRDPNDAGILPRIAKRWDKPIRGILKEREMTFNQWGRVFQTIQNTTADCFSTPGSVEMVTPLVKLGTAGLKISGADMNYLDLIRVCAATGLPVLLDARCTMKELHEAVTVCRGEGNERITIVHCPSGYPAPSDKINLPAITLYRKEFPNFQIGFSDHSTGWGMCIAAVMMGATYIEKTVTVNRNIQSPEHIMSLHCSQVQEFVDEIKSLRYAMQPTPIPEVIDSPHRRSLFMEYPVAEGTVIEMADIQPKRPSNGISVSRISEVVGRVAVRDLVVGHKLSWSDLKPLE